MELQRNVLIVDDSADLTADIELYESIFHQIKQRFNLDYNIKFEGTPYYDKAIEKLKSKEQVYDVLLIDYDLSTVGNKKDGAELVKEIREGINRHCKIIFYSMSYLDEVFHDREARVKFINCGLYKFIPKMKKTESQIIYGNKTHQLRVEAMIEAIEDIDYVQVSLERYFAEYSDLVLDERIYVDGQEYTIEEIINYIRNDDEVGRNYRRNLAKSLILHNIALGVKK
ncbi:hypothetical protein J31TS6_59120 [Brevibacillus reuszeri]|uniref:hypothetical protein n=1 Tax=Brevibacillus reuszeri TaxID=54915 RepID=UPI001B0A4914|nr:hypothetical protein [Brevibacillus reuszeri]GIO09884.1 hypothetical protein J31TS6_59120 [Brevibacillus reuszeri]